MPLYNPHVYSPKHMSCGEAEQMFNVHFEPCPFCKAPFPLVFVGPHPYVECPNCGADGPRSTIPGLDGVPEAVSFWNKRP